MNHFHQVVGIVAGILALAGYIPYLYTTVCGKTRPNKATWFIWTLVGGLLAVSYIAEGDQYSIWVPISYFIGPLITAILSIRYGYSEWTKLDFICLATAVISIIPWILSKNATMTLLINILIDCTGAIPTIVKTYREPETEDFTAWLIFFIANTLGVISVSQWSLAGIYPIYLFLLAGTIVLFTLKNKIKQLSSSD